jgi:hypothetical protein
MMSFDIEKKDFQVRAKKGFFSSFKNGVSSRMMVF